MYMYIREGGPQTWDQYTTTQSEIVFSQGSSIPSIIDCINGTVDMATKINLSTVISTSL